MRITETIIYLIIGINVLTFFVYGIDKWLAKQGRWRISEATLLMLAVIGGSIGALLGMRIWHHKTMHKKFKYGLPAILLAQIALLSLTSCRTKKELVISKPIKTEPIKHKPIQEHSPNIFLGYNEHRTSIFT